MSVRFGAVTADELSRLPSGRERYELVDGGLRRMTPAGHMHGRIAALVGASLTAFVRANGLGETYAAETGFLLRRDPDTVRAPDAAFVSVARLAAMNVDPAGYFPGAPDLAVEVLSPSDAARETAGKVGDWLRSGCRAVLVVDPLQRSAMVHRAGAPPESFVAPDVVRIEDVVPGWSLALAEVFL